MSSSPAPRPPLPGASAPTLESSAAAPGASPADTPWPAPGDPRIDASLTNEDLAALPPEKRTWSWYNIFAFWMSDVHSVGGYVTAGSLFALGLASWQVLVALVVGIVIVQVFVNLVAKPSQVTGTPYPVINRAIFGVRGANVPAVIRGVIAVAWYGVQTYLASAALVIVILKFFPQAAVLHDVEQHGFLGLSVLGYIAYGILWAAQALVFWRGMEAIRRFIDVAGPAVYVVMLVLAIYLVSRAGWQDIDLRLGSAEPMSLAAAVPVMVSAIALVVSYFSGPMLNFGDFARYARDLRSVKRGNFWGLPVNFLFFSLLTVLTAAATVPVFGELLTDPIETVARIDTPFAILLGGLTFIVATVGINIVANFIAPAFDFSNVAPQRISWRAGGMIAAVGSVLLTPWNWYSNDEAIHYTLGILGGFIGPLFGVLIAGYYVISRQRVVVPDLYSTSPAGSYWYRRGHNPNAIAATAIGGIAAIATVIAPTLVLDLGLTTADVTWLGDFSWFLGCGLGFLALIVLEHRRPRIRVPGAERSDVVDGSRIDGREAA